MFLKLQLSFLAIVAWINEATCASFSKVYVQNGAESLPVDYVQYGTPSFTYTGQQLAKVSSGTISSSYLQPCAPPQCVYPAETIATFAPSANIVSYRAPQTSPVILAQNRNEPTGYEYSYVVYDQESGDHKKQRELSDGSVVRGEYSFLQPDEFVREVKYVADEFRGFNAIVNNIRPVADEEKKTIEITESINLKPCREPESETLKKGNEESSESSDEKHELSSESKSSQEEQTHEKLVKSTPETEGEEHLEDSNEEPSSDQKLHEQKAIPELVLQNHANTLVGDNLLVPYNDIIRCIESALKGATAAQQIQSPVSPLTYIILNKPC